MKINLYIGLRGGMFGGAENTIVAVTEALSRKHSLEIITHDPEMTIESFAKTGNSLNATMRYVPEEPIIPTGIRLNRRAAVRRWHQGVSDGSDVFLNFANRSPPFSHARCGIARVFFPFDLPQYKCQGTGVRASLRSAYLRNEWNARWSTYDALTANSAYTAMWVKKRWGKECRVIHPPVDIDFEVMDKAPLIVSVGRFAVYENVKKQLELMHAFAALKDLRENGWRHVSVGGAGTDEGDLHYIDTVKQASPPGAEIYLDAPRPEMKAALGRARIFWHAAGWGEDPLQHPERYEHFGQSTVEAMAAGCVPVVINGGGQPEIVEHGVSGFLWKNQDELLEFTRILANDSALMESMSRAAIQRSAAFSKQIFADRFCALIDEVAVKKGIPV